MELSSSSMLSCIYLVKPTKVHFVFIPYSQSPTVVYTVTMLRRSWGFWNKQFEHVQHAQTTIKYDFLLTQPSTASNLFRQPNFTCKASVLFLKHFPQKMSRTGTICLTSRTDISDISKNIGKHSRY